jgi:hypothetical protein
MSFDFGTSDTGVTVDQPTSGAIARGLHQAAQPLSVLQGTLELALLQANSVREYKDAVERSLEELQRVTECFKNLCSLPQTSTASHRPAIENRKER